MWWVRVSDLVTLDPRPRRKVGVRPARFLLDGAHVIRDVAVRVVNSGKDVRVLDLPPTTTLAQRGVDALEADAEFDPPDGEARETGRSSCGHERLAIVAADGLRKAMLADEP
jgi:hypothetical protein